MSDTKDVKEVKASPYLHMTARELLVDVAGVEHELHTLVWRKRSSRGKIEIECSCGDVKRVTASDESIHALRNVRER